ncbi:MAG: bifunctional folylpolyglutamate synthase/dihydrofolate synthase, partial [Clostridia bacterium]|nr:bifunctional folylpolyglutamate synthase/dihydrofolate synthase [Clostridia bacterium]
HHLVVEGAGAAGGAAAAARSGLRLGPLHLREGLAQTQWPGRLEVVRRRPWVVLDGAHNPNGAEALRRSLALFPHRRYLLVAGVLADKDAAGILGALAAGAHRVVLTRPEGPRAADPVTLADLLPPDTPRTVEPDPVRAVTEALRDAGEEDLICVAGSLFLVGPIRRYFTGETAPLPG